jgi:hypothetical protein
MSAEIVCRHALGATLGKGQTVPPYVVAQVCDSGIRFQRARSQDEAKAIRDAWRRGEYRHWPGVIRPA